MLEPETSVSLKQNESGRKPEAGFLMDSDSSDKQAATATARPHEKITNEETGFQATLQKSSVRGKMFGAFFKVYFTIPYNLFQFGEEQLASRVLTTYGPTRT